MNEQITPSARNAILLGIVIGLLIYDVVIGDREGFTTRSDKAAAIVNWFKNNPVPTYTRYKDAFAEPNIVEYEDMLALHQNGNLIKATAEERLR